MSKKRALVGLKICRYCGNDFSTKYRRQKYCSRRCYGESKRLVHSSDWREDTSSAAGRPGESNVDCIHYSPCLTTAAMNGDKQLKCENCEHYELYEDSEKGHTWLNTHGEGK